MRIIYNPLNGSPVKGFRHQRVGELALHPVGQLKQYDDDVAEDLLKIFGFLEEVTPQKAQEILAKPKEAAYKCEYCPFSSDHKVALAGHRRSHQEEIAKAKEPQVDPSIIPMAEATPVVPNKSADERRQEDLTSGPEFYGPGLTETKSPRPANVGT